MLFDIRDEDRAVYTLEELTGVGADYWFDERIKSADRYDFTNADKDIERALRRYNGSIPSLDEIELIITHLTSSGNGCESIRKNGLIELKKAYSCGDSELRAFLDAQGIEILIDSCCLRYRGRYFDISYEDCPVDHESEEYAAWSIGRKIYYDFTVCGFLSLNEKQVYAGNVHRRPEILWDLDKLLHTNLQELWQKDHKPYEVVFTIPVKDTIYNGWDSDSEEEMVMNYLTDAYMCALTGPDTREILCCNDVEVFPDQIKSCRRFHLWR